MEKMRALTIHQPFAAAICRGFKRVENRTWTTNYRGPVAIHASANCDRLKGLREQLGSGFDEGFFPVGAVVGVADLVDVQALNVELESNPFAEGPFCWIFERPRLLAEPVKGKGKTSLFFLSEADSACVVEQLKASPIVASDEFAAIVTAIACDATELQLVRAEIYWENEKFEDVVRCGSNLIEIDTVAAAGWRVRALGHSGLGHFEAALADANRAIELEPEFGYSYVTRSDIYRALGDLAKAEADYSRGLELSPEIGGIEGENLGDQPSSENVDE
jgi:tetratricopeptide (TPR) repeat protein